MLLNALNGYPQFILWKTGIRDGKLTKLPVSAHTGEICDAHNPQSWATYDQALHAAGGHGCNIGFVFTEADPFFFLDIDHCAVDGGWSPLALEILATLPGAAVEVSHSGKGLHVFGTYSNCPPHARKNVGLGIELYTERRFVALTYNQLSGDAGTDCTAALGGLIVKYWQPNGAEAASVSWTTQPVPEWTPVSDIDIINKAGAAASPAVAFGSKISFADLWNANSERIGQFFPDHYGDRPYDASSADAALAQHLAFWCGNNCEHIERMMRMSGLHRDKWDKRPDYMQRTIGGAVARQVTVYTGGTKEQPAQVVTPVVGDEAAPGATLLAATQQQELFAGCVYISNIHGVLIPDGRILKPEQFRAVYGGYDFVLDYEGKSTKNAWEAFTESRVVQHAKVTGTCFRPELEPGAVIDDEGFKMVNTYVPVVTPRASGDPSPFLNHVRAMLPNGDDAEILLSYMAAIVQYPGSKFQWAPLLQGCEGNGKTMFIRCVEFAVGKRYTHLPNSSDMGQNGSKFNAWIENKLFIGLEEIYVADRREVADALKPLITNSRIEIQGKGANQVTGDNRANFIMCSNHKDAVRKTANDRRYCVLYTAQQSVADMEACGFTGDYFPNLYDWLCAGGYEIVNEYLHKYRIADRYNPATACHRAPMTSSTNEAIIMSRGRVEQEIYEAIDEGRPGFAGGWISSMALDRLLEDIRATKAIPINKRRQMLEDMGYSLHPALPGGRSTCISHIDEGKPRLFLQAGHMALNLTGTKDIAAAYSKAQGSTLPGDNYLLKAFGSK